MIAWRKSRLVVLFSVYNILIILIVVVHHSWIPSTHSTIDLWVAGFPWIPSIHKYRKPLISNSRDLELGFKPYLIGEYLTFR